MLMAAGLYLSTVDSLPAFLKDNTNNPENNRDEILSS